MRKLTVSDSKNLNGAKEFNHLRIKNLDEFLDGYTNNLDYYASPFRILFDLEQKISFMNNPDETILIPYKPEGEIIFDLNEVREEGGLRIVEYHYSSSIS